MIFTSAQASGEWKGVKAMEDSDVSLPPERPSLHIKFRDNLDLVTTVVNPIFVRF